MSSILEALKKLEAEKHAQMAPVEQPEPAYSMDYDAGPLLGKGAYAAPAQHRLAPVTLVLAGGFFTMLLVAVSVLLSLLVMQRGQNSGAPVATTANPALAAALPASPSAAVSPSDPSVSALAGPPSLPDVPAAEADTQTPAPKPAPARRSTSRDNAPAVVTPVEVHYEPYIPKPAADAPRKKDPIPEDIRTLPMLSRNDRSHYNLENLSLNMLNEANAQRPTGNAIINLEKVFVGETLPGTNAKLVDVRSHGIAVEILSSHQRFYIPR